jgi:RimJ/RimL family protein N-acetyltransferase
VVLRTLSQAGLTNPSSAGPLARTLGITIQHRRVVTTLHTARLRLEPLKQSHLDDIYVIDSNPEVARYVDGEPATLQQTLDWISRVERCWAAWGFSWWAWIELDTGFVVGTGCIQHSRREAKFPPDPNSLRANPLEIGWRLRRDTWGRGLATEAAAEMTRFAFERLDATELIAISHPDNTASIRVMERLRMTYRGVERWYGQPSATYSIRQEAWLRGRH